MPICSYYTREQLEFKTLGKLDKKKMVTPMTSKLKTVIILLTIYSEIIYIY